jgi:hypothetical protein
MSVHRKFAAGTDPVEEKQTDVIFMNDIPL